MQLDLIFKIVATFFFLYLSYTHILRPIYMESYNVTFAIHCFDMFCFVCGVSVSQIIFERDVSGDTGVGISTGEFIVGILGVCIDNELSGVKISDFVFFGFQNITMTFYMTK